MFRKLLIPILILGVVVVLVIGYYYPSFFGLGSKTKETAGLTENQINSKRVSTLMSTLDFYSSSNIIALLSIKYSLSTDTLISVLNDYNNITRPDYDFDNFSIAEIKNNLKNDVSNVSASLNAIAKNYDIQPATLVNIIIDYKLLKNANRQN
jgi:hypothetical protein